MSRKKKTKLKDPIVKNGIPESTDGLKRLKEGTVVMYKAPYVFDKCTVESVDKSNSTAILSNGVRVSRGILPDGHLLRIGNTTESTEVRVWDDYCELEYKFFLAKRYASRFAEKINKGIDTMGKAEVVALSDKLKKIEAKFLL